MEQKGKNELTVRLQKYLAQCNIASRRKCEDYILQKKVTVNGKIVDKLGEKVNPNKDRICFEGRRVQEEKNKIYILLNKPIGYVTTTKEQFDRQTVFDLLPNISTRVVPVGRLDMYTSGALILSNDGNFVYTVTHPKHEIEKTYQVTIRGSISEEELEPLKKGINIEDYQTKPAKVKIMKIEKEQNISRVKVIIHEGRNRQVRKMFQAIGKNVLALHRSAIGNISVKNMKIGQWRYLTKEEVESLK